MQAEALAAQARERWLDANGLTHHVLCWGDEAGPPVVLCHGFLDLAWGFAELGPALAARGYRVYAPDFRGHGESGRVPAGGYYYFPDYVRDLHALLPQLTQAPFHLVGHSMGGTVSVMYAATHREQVRTLVLLEGLGPPAEEDSAAPARARAWLESTEAGRTPAFAELRDRADAHARLAARHPHASPALLELLAAKSTCTHPSAAGLTWRFDPLHRTRSPLAFDRDRFLYFLAELRAPTLVIAGERGLRSGDEPQRVARIADVDTATLSGAGHMLHWSHASQVVALASSHFARA